MTYTHSAPFFDDDNGKPHAFPRLLNRVSARWGRWAILAVAGVCLVAICTLWGRYNATDVRNIQLLATPTASSSSSSSYFTSSCPPPPPCPSTSCPATKSCPPRMEATKDDGMAGQVKTDKLVARWLYDLAIDPTVHLVLETGTFNCRGSTQNTVRGLKETGGRLNTIEGMLDMFLIARKVLRNEPATVVLGTVVDPEDLPSLALDNGEKVDYSFDMIFLDGAEFLGPAEFKVTMRDCKPRYLLLHDAQTFKHFLTVVELEKAGSGYKLPDKGIDHQGAGYAVFKRTE